MSKTFTYGEFTKELDLLDYECMGKIEDAMDAFTERYDKATQEERQSDKMKGCIHAIAELFDKSLGDDASNKILGKKTNLEEALDAEKAFVDFVKEQSEEAEKKYSASLPNRAQRRTKR